MSTTKAIVSLISAHPGITGDEIKAELATKSARGVIDAKLTVLVELDIVERRKPSSFQAGKYHPKNKFFLRQFLGIAKPFPAL